MGRLAMSHVCWSGWWPDEMLLVITDLVCVADDVDRLLPLPSTSDTSSRWPEALTVVKTGRELSPESGDRTPDSTLYECKRSSHDNDISGRILVLSFHLVVHKTYFWCKNTNLLIIACLIFSDVSPKSDINEEIYYLIHLRDKNGRVLYWKLILANKKQLLQQAIWHSQSPTPFYLRLTAFSFVQDGTTPDVNSIERNVKSTLTFYSSCQIFV